MAISGGVRIIPVIAVAKLVTLLALFGWFASRERLACFASLMFAGYALMLTLFGRPNNFYWCLMITPTLLLGLIFLPQAATDVWRQLRFRPGLASAAMGERASLRSPE